MRLLQSFLHLVPLVERFVMDTCFDNHIDISHNLHHSHQVKELGFLIAQQDYHLNRKQQETLYLSCMLHDMCDAKYVPRIQGILDISNFLRKHCSMDVHDGVLNIITTMSYNQIVSSHGHIQYPNWLQCEHNFKEVFHITREADLLTSYDMKRMVHYKHDRLGFIYSSDIYEDIMDTVENRMSQLISRNLFVSPTAQRIAYHWHHHLCHVVLPSLSCDDIYPILYQPPETLEDFQKRLQSIVKNDFSFNTGKEKQTPRTNNIFLK